MHTRLVADLNHASQRLIVSGAHSANYRILGLVREIRRVESYIDPPFNSKRNYNQIYNNMGSEERASAGVRRYVGLG